MNTAAAARSRAFMVPASLHRVPVRKKQKTPDPGVLGALRRLLPPSSPHTDCTVDPGIPPGHGPRRSVDLTGCHRRSGIDGIEPSHPAPEDCGPSVLLVVIVGNRRSSCQHGILVPWLKLPSFSSRSIGALQPRL